MRVPLSLVFRTALVAVAPVVVASAAVAAEASAARSEAAAIVGKTAQLIREHYVYPEKADRIIARLNENLASGRYDVANKEKLAALLTEDLLALTNDKHMYVKALPPVAAAPANPTPATAGPPANPMAAMAAASNQGLTEMRILPGNVRYINLFLFFWEPDTQAAYDGAIEFLRGGDAYVIDVRGNGGGSGAAVNYLISHFMEPGRKLMDYRIGPSGTQDSVTRGDLTGERLDERPLFLLTGPATGSAAEEFAAHVRNFELGTLVGQTTAGAGHRNSTFMTPEGFQVSVSTGTAIHPVTKLGWEATGIEPHIRTPVGDALEVAHREALRRIAQDAPEPQKKQLAPLIDRVSAKIDPVSLDPATIRGLLGQYEKERSLIERAGKLYWKQGAHEWELLPLDQSRFIFASGPPIQLAFVEEGDRFVAVDQISPSGNRERFARE